MAYYMFGVGIASGRARCRGCQQKIKKGEKTFWHIGDAYYNRPVIYFWHPRCFFQTHAVIIKDVISLFLPMLIGEEEAKPILVALNLR
jgi:hypothetical protein